MEHSGDGRDGARGRVEFLCEYVEEVLLGSVDLWVFCDLQRGRGYLGNSTDGIELVGAWRVAVDVVLCEADPLLRLCDLGVLEGQRGLQGVLCLVVGVLVVLSEDGVGYGSPECCQALLGLFLGFQESAEYQFRCFIRVEGAVAPSVLPNVFEDVAHALIGIQRNGRGIRGRLWEFADAVLSSEEDEEKPLAGTL